MGTAAVISKPVIDFMAMPVPFVYAGVLMDASLPTALPTASQHAEHSNTLEKDGMRTHGEVDAKQATGRANR